MVESKPYRPPEGNESNILTTRNKGKASNPKMYRGKNFEIDQVWNPNKRLNPRAGALTWKAIFLTLGQEHPTNLPK